MRTAWGRTTSRKVWRCESPIDRAAVPAVVLGQVLLYGALFVSLGVLLATRCRRPILLDREEQRAKVPRGHGVVEPPVERLAVLDAAQNTDVGGAKRMRRRIRPR